MLWMGELGLEDVGIDRGRLSGGLGLTLGTWGLAQVIAVVGAFATGGEARVHLELGLRQLHLTLGALATHVLSVSLYEEVAYRGYLLPQLYALLGGRGRRLALGGALVLSQGLYAALHVPLLMFMGMAPDFLPFAVLGIAIMGLAFALIYLCTGNLFFAMGVHTLVTAPTPLFAFPGPDWLGTLLASLAIALLSGSLPRGLGFSRRSG